jgi:serine/threonine-protein kinase HipA
MTAYAGFGKAPPRKALERLARQAGVSQWAEVVRMIELVRDVLAWWGEVARELGVGEGNKGLVGKVLEAML